MKGGCPLFYSQYRGTNWSDRPLAQLHLATAETTRGFTGHEQLADVGLIHMNGRAYDPQLGRFISADPYIQFASNLQSYNRYSYLHNNPLSYTDPSGYNLEKLSKAIDKNIDTVFLVAASATGNPIVVALMAAAIAGKNGASTRDAIKAGVIAGLRSQAFTQAGTATTGLGIPAKMLAHGMIGGVSSGLQGGSFNDGFIVSALSARAAPYAGNVVNAALIGGAISSINGGKFSTGAVAAAMGYAFNWMKHGESRQSQANAESCTAGTVSCKALIGKYENKQYDGSIDSDRDWMGRKHITIRGNYLCTACGSSPEAVEGTRRFWYWFEKADTLKHYNVEYQTWEHNWQINKPMASDPIAKPFNPYKSDVQELKDWANTK